MNAVKWDEINRYVKGKSLAIVGNSLSQFSVYNGQYIDNADIVVRMNWGLIKDKKIQGDRTDILSLSAVVGPKDLATFNPDYIMWATNKREHMPEYDRMYIHQDEHWGPLYKDLGHRPSTGLITLNFFVNHTECGMVYLYGYDSFNTKTFYHYAQWKGPHDPKSERAFISKLVKAGKVESKEYVA